MPKLPVLSGEQAVRAFERAGWRRDRQRGSHVTLIREHSPLVLTVPLHDSLGPGILRALIRKANLTVEEFTAFLR